MHDYKINMGARHSGPRKNQPSSNNKTSFEENNSRREASLSMREHDSLVEVVSDGRFSINQAVSIYQSKIES